MVETIAEVLLPGGFTSALYQPETVFTTATTVGVYTNNQYSTAPVQARLYRGWPVPNNLRISLENNIAEVSVFSVPGMTQLMSKWLENTYVASTVPVTFIATVVGTNMVEFSGTATVGQVTGVAIAPGVIGKAYCIRLNNTDTPQSIAATLAGIIPGASASGFTLTVPTGNHVLAGTVGDSTVNYTTGLQSQMFDIHIWAPNPQMRDAVGKTLSTGLSQIMVLQFEDGSTSENMLYRGTWVEDMSEATSSWHRYQRYEVIYPTIRQEVDPGVLFVGIRLNDTKLIGQFDYRVLN